MGYAERMARTREWWWMLLLLVGCGQSPRQPASGQAVEPPPRHAAPAQVARALPAEPRPLPITAPQRLRVGKVPPRARQAGNPLVVHQQPRRRASGTVVRMAASRPQVRVTAPRLPDPLPYPTGPVRRSAPRVVVIPRSQMDNHALQHWEAQQARIRAQNQALIEQAMRRPNPVDWNPPAPARVNIPSMSQPLSGPSEARRAYYRAQADFLNTKYCSNGPPRWNEHNVAGSLSTVAPPNPVLMSQPAMHNPVLQSYQRAQQLRPAAFP